MSQLLQGKTAVIYGGGGSLGGAIARAFADEGATVFLVGRQLASVQKVTNEIIAAGGLARAVVADALSRAEVERLVLSITADGASLDISLCAIDYQVVQGMPMVELDVEDFTRPVALAARSNFLTATAAGRVMMNQRTGVILTLTATPGGIAYPYTAGFAPACSVIETFSRNLASELGPFGVRVVNLRSAGSPDSEIFRHAIERNPKEMNVVLGSMQADTMLKRLPSMEDIANTAVFLASSHAKSITGVTIDVTAGTTAGLNYRVKTKLDSSSAKSLRGRCGKLSG